MAFTPRRLMRGASGGAADPDSTYKISRSLRFNSADSTSLTRTPASAGNRRTYTFSTWVKRSQSATGNAMLASVSGSAFNYFSFGTSVGDFITFAYFDGASDVFGVNTNGAGVVFRDVSAWYHIVLAVDTTQATASNRVKIYVNGVQLTIAGTYPTQNYDTPINNSILNIIGGGTGSYTAYLSNQYMTEINFIDGTQLTPSSFGETNARTGVWQPKAYSGSYGTNGFYLNFSDNSNTTAATLGKDYSGNGNNWTPNNFSVTAGAGNDSMVDSPTSYGVDTGVGGEVRGNYCTWNSLVKPYGITTFTNGDLDVRTNGNWNAVVGTIGITTGKWYWEVISGEQNNFIGIQPIGQNYAVINPQDFNGVFVCDDNQKLIDGTRTAYTSTGHPAGTVVGVAVDLDAGSLTFYKNGVSQGAINFASSLTYGKTVLPTIIPYYNGYTHSANFGQKPFVYSAPSGYKAVCTRNLPTPTIGATSTTLADDYFGIATYTGNGTARSLSLGFQPDFTWIKNRNSTYSHLLVDSIRGGSNYVSTNNTTVEQGGQSLITSWDSNGVNLGTWVAANENTLTFVAWNWKAGGTAVTNTSGTISSQVSASPRSGFSIVTYTGTGANATIGHGLGAVPSVIITKNLTQAGNYFAVYTSMVGNTKTLWLSSNDAAVTSSQYWNNTTPTSSVFSVGSAGPMNGSTHSMLAYCFAPIAGYSAFGSYTGNGSTDGPFVHTGFRPAYVMIKRSDSTDGGEWKIHDATRTPFNWTCNVLFAQASDAENTAEAQATYGVDMLSNGFKIRASHSSHNTSTAVYIYMAFASNPFKYSLAR